LCTDRRSLRSFRTRRSSDLVELMLEYSDNVIAEVLAREVALARGLPGSFTGAATALEQALVELGLPMGDPATGEVTLADGSGLSRKNLLTADLLTALLRRAATATPDDPLAGVVAGLPVAGWSGT